MSYRLSSLLIEWNSFFGVSLQTQMNKLNFERCLHTIEFRWQRFIISFLELLCLKLITSQWLLLWLDLTCYCFTKHIWFPTKFWILYTFFWTQGFKLQRRIFILTNLLLYRLNRISSGTFNFFLHVFYSLGNNLAGFDWWSKR